MSVIRVTAEQLGSTASTVQSAAETIYTTSQNALRAVVNLTEEGWQGGGSAAAGQAIQEWQKGAQMVHEALTTIGNLITQAEGAYTDTDSSVAKSFAS